MLVSLLVKNFAIIDNIQIDFDKDMTVLTGETGSGKSLIIDAIGLLFGKRASSDVIRYGEAKATIEGAFSEIPTKVSELLDIEINEEDYLVIKREIYSNGKSICKINNQIVSLSQLVDIAEAIGDIHSQFDTQGLFNPKNYLQFIDDEDIIKEIKLYQENLTIYNEANLEYQNLIKKNNDDNQKIDFLKFQINELQKAKLSILEEEELKVKSNYLNNFETIRKNSVEFMDLYQNNNILDSIFDSVNILSKIETYDSKFSKYKKQIEESYYNLSDAIEEISHVFSKIDFDSDELETINERLGLYSDLKRKYKKSTNEIIDYYNMIKKEIDLIENYDSIISNLKNKVDEAYHKTYTIANNIREKRLVQANILEKKVKSNLNDLQLKNTLFQVMFNDVTKPVFMKDGIDEIDFMITFNKGEPMRPLSKTASGGELSRFMLSLKTLVCEKLNLQTIIFDEIDNGVSGAIAYSIANKIKEISKKSQVLCVTHLPQVAAIADNHLNISKKIDIENRTITEIKKLNYDERILEIAKMISNGEITQASKNLAIELLQK